MGLFNRKKKQQVDETDEMLASYGAVRNEGTLQQNITRKEAQAQSQANQVNQNKKQEIIRQLNDLKNRMNHANEDYGNEILQLEDLTRAFNHQNFNTNNDAMSKIDQMISICIHECLDNVNRGAAAAIGPNLLNLDTLINDRESCPSYYLDKKFLQLRLEANKREAAIAVNDAEIKKFKILGQQILKKIEDPKYAADIGGFKRQLNALGQKIKTYEMQNQMYESKQREFDLAMEAFKADATFNTPEMDDNLAEDLVTEALEKQQENQMTANTSTKNIDRFMSNNMTKSCEDLDAGSLTESNTASNTVSDDVKNLFNF